MSDRIAIMSAIPGELRMLRSRRPPSGAVLVESGIGKVNAAVVTTRLILEHRPDIILFTGVAGGLDPDLGVGDVVVGERTIQHDAGVRFDGRLEPYQAGHVPSSTRPRCSATTRRRSCSPPPEGRSRRWIWRRCWADSPGRRGVILTGDQFIRSPLAREQMHRDFGAQAVEMEGAAVAQVADRFGVDCLVLRAVSDHGGRGVPSRLRPLHPGGGGQLRPGGGAPDRAHLLNRRSLDEPVVLEYNTL
jgi:nucleoside phosphorylase